MTKTAKRPRDPNQLAKNIVDIATGAGDAAAPVPMTVNRIVAPERRVTPAMAARVTDKLWKMSNLVAVLEAVETVPAKRGPYKKREPVT